MTPEQHKNRLRELIQDLVDEAHDVGQYVRSLNPTDQRERAYLVAEAAARAALEAALEPLFRAHAVTSIGDDDKLWIDELWRKIRYAAGKDAASVLRYGDEDDPELHGCVQIAVTALLSERREALLRAEKAEALLAAVEAGRERTSTVGGDG